MPLAELSPALHAAHIVIRYSPSLSLAMDRRHAAILANRAPSVLLETGVPSAAHETWASAAARAMPHAQANPVSRPSLVASARSRSPMQSSGHELLHDLLLLLHGWLVRYGRRRHARLLQYIGRPLCRSLLLYGQVLLERNI